MKCVIFFQTIKASDTIKMFLKQYYYNWCISERKLENIQYICNFNTEHADFETLSTSKEVIISLIPDTVVDSATVINKFVRLDSSVDIMDSLLLSSNFCLYS